MRILIDLACAQDDDDDDDDEGEQHADTGSEAEFDDTSLQGPSFFKEDDENMEWRHKLPSDKGDVHQFVGEENWLNKAAAPNIPENSQRIRFLLHFQNILQLIIQKTNRYMQQDAQTIKTDIPHSQEINTKDFMHFLKLFFKWVTITRLV
jgi:hypothetical protein